jgi:two-component system NtrC family sensor kinase
MLSDVVMPGGMNGIKLAQIVRERRPTLPILLATGYSQHALQPMSEGFTLIEKPYDRNTLAAAIRLAIGSGYQSQPPIAKCGAGPAKP